MLRDTRRSSKPEYRARYPDARPFLATRTGVSQDFTGLVAAVQLRHRVAFGLQALQRCSGLLNRRARGSTVATHHFADVAQQRQQQFRKLPGAFAPRECESLHRLHFRIRGEIIIILRFERRVCRWDSCRMHQFTGMWLNPNSRGSRLRIWQPWGCKSLHAHHFGMSTGRAGRTCLLNSGLPEKGVWCESTAFRHSCARSSKRAGGLIPRIALDQCRVPERYRTRVPF